MFFRFRNGRNVTGIFSDFVTFKFSNDYMQILLSEKGHFYSFEVKGRGLDSQHPRSGTPDCIGELIYKREHSTLLVLNR